MLLAVLRDCTPWRSPLVPTAFSLCLQGVLGEVVPLPEGLASTDALWTVPPGEDIEHVQLVRWRLGLPDGVGQWVLLCRMAGEAAARGHAHALRTHACMGACRHAAAPFVRPVKRHGSAMPADVCLCLPTVRLP